MSTTEQIQENELKQNKSYEEKLAEVQARPGVREVMKVYGRQTKKRTLLDSR